MTANEPIYRRNFYIFLIDAVLFTLAMGVVGSTTVVPDFVRRLTDSEILIGLSGSVFTIGYSLPQLFIARFIVRKARKKWWFVGPNIPVRFMMLIFAFILVRVGTGRPGIILTAFFICYAIAALGDGLVGVPWADLTATSLDSRWRARMFGLMTAITGVAMLFIAPWIGRVLGENGPGFPNNYALIFAVAGGIFVVSTLPGIFVHELPGGQVAEESPPMLDYLSQLGRVIREDRAFRSFLLVSTFTGFYMMSAPFYIGFATEDLGLSSQVAVPVLLAMQTVGSVGGAIAYTWIGARHNVQYIRVALFSAALLPICALLAQAIGPFVLYIGFFLSGLSASGNLFAAYLNWVVSYAHEDSRPMFVGMYNTLNALIWLITPFISGAIAQRFGFQPLFYLSILMALSGLYVTVRYLQPNEVQIPEPV